MSHPRPVVPLVLAAPSGAGKTTIARELVASDPRYGFSVSATTRPPRPGERDGVDYHFLDDAEFDARVAAGAFAEWARVHGRAYGTLHAELDRLRAEGRVPVLDIDVQGALQVREQVPDALLVFVLPPSAGEMLRRLRSRGTERESEVQRRLETALDELTRVELFDYVVVNSLLDDAVRAVDGIVRAEGSRVDRAEGLGARVADLVAGIEAELAEDGNRDSRPPHDHSGGP